MTSPLYFIAEIGINHNGDMELAKKLIQVASVAGADAVKFQKREPDICVPEKQKAVIRETPWGEMTYLEYKKRLEFSKSQYLELRDLSHELGLDFSASAWDLPSLEFIQDVGVDFHKIASALATNETFVRAVSHSKLPIFLSTGMMNLETMDAVVETANEASKLTLMHTVSTYPTNEADLNLSLIPWMRERYGLPVGYSGHESSLSPSIVAAALGASAIERHITLDRAMWGTDHAASLNPQGLIQLVGSLKKVSKVIGVPEKRMFAGEEQVAEKLRYWS